MALNYNLIDSIISGYARQFGIVSIPNDVTSLITCLLPPFKDIAYYERTFKSSIVRLLTDENGNKPDGFCNAIFTNPQAKYHWFNNKFIPFLQNDKYDYRSEVIYLHFMKFWTHHSKLPLGTVSFLSRALFLSDRDVERIVRYPDKWIPFEYLANSVDTWNISEAPARAADKLLRCCLKLIHFNYKEIDITKQTLIDTYNIIYPFIVYIQVIEEHYIDNWRRNIISNNGLSNYLYLNGFEFMHYVNAWSSVNNKMDQSDRPLFVKKLLENLFITNRRRDILREKQIIQLSTQFVQHYDDQGADLELFDFFPDQILYHFLDLFWDLSVYNYESDNEDIDLDFK